MPGPSGVLVHAFDGWSGQFVEDWYDLGAVELVYEMWGPETARLAGSRRLPFWDRQRCMPGGRGVYLQVDPTDQGLPLWTGRLTKPQPSSTSPEVSAEVTGPREWVDRYHTALATRVPWPAATIMRQALAASPPNPPLRFSDSFMHLGLGGDDDTAARPMWELMTTLATGRGEWFYLVARPWEVAYDLHWRHPLGGDNRAGDVLLVNGVNAEFDYVPDIEGKIDTLLVAAQAWHAGPRQNGSGARISPARAFGRKAALEALTTSLTTRWLTGASQTDSDPTVATRDAAAVAAEARLRLLCNSAVPTQIRVLDTALWPYLRPGTIVSAQWEDDPHRLFQSCLTQIETMTVSPLTGEMNCSAFLWDARE